LTGGSNGISFSAAPEENYQEKPPNDVRRRFIA
jgi:hypothetical protein